MTKRIEPLMKAANVLKKAGYSDMLLAAKSPNGPESAIHGNTETLSYLLLKLQNHLMEELFPLAPIREKVFKEAPDA